MRSAEGRRPEAAKKDERGRVKGSGGSCGGCSELGTEIHYGRSGKVRFIRRDNNEMNVAAASSSRLTGGERGERREGGGTPKRAYPGAGTRGTKAAVLAFGAIGRELDRAEIESSAGRNGYIICIFARRADYVTRSGSTRSSPVGGGGGATRARDTLANAIRPKSATEIGNTESSRDLWKLVSQREKI